MLWKKGRENCELVFIFPSELVYSPHHLQGLYPMPYLPSHNFRLVLRCDVVLAGTLRKTTSKNSIPCWRLPGSDRPHQTILLSLHDALRSKRVNFSTSDFAPSQSTAHNKRGGSLVFLPVQKEGERERECVPRSPGLIRISGDNIALVKSEARET